MKAIFLIPLENGSPTWPQMDGDSGPRVAYVDPITGQRKGSCSCIGQVPNTSTCLGLIETSDAQMLLIRADPRWEWVEEVPDAQSI